MIDLPPLRERMQDLELFVAAFIDEFNQEMGKNLEKVSDEALERMKHYHWPGNIRELRNVIERGMVLCDGRQIQVAHLPGELCDSAAVLSGPTLSTALPPEGVNLEDMVSQLERRLIEEALAKTGGNQSEAAEILSISRDQLRYRLEKYGPF
jgi:two-component system NtrC family response regulator